MTIPPQNETSKERKIREALESALAPGEMLLEYSLAHYNAGVFSNQLYWVGLTAQRLVFIKPKKRGQVYSIGYETIASLTYTLKSNLLPTLQLELGSGPGQPVAKAGMMLTANKEWNAHFTALAAAFNRERSAAAERPGQPATAQQFVEQVQELQGLEMWNAAQALTQARMERDPFFQADEAAQALLHQLGNSRLAMRVAAVIFGIVILFLLYFAIQGQAKVGLGMVLAIVAVINLVRGSAGARGNALVLALLTAGINVIFNAVGNSLVDMLMWAAFGLAMCLLLIGRPDRLRTLLGAAVFGIGTVGLFAFFVLGAMYFPGAVSWLAPGGNEPFSDAFSNTRDSNWATNSDAQVVAKLESGGYSIQVKEAGMVYFAFPPILYSPVRGEVDAQVLGNYTQQVPGALGMICRYQQDGDKYYIVYVDVYGGGYLAERIAGTEETPLTDPAWQEARGLKDPGQVNRIGLSCQNNQLSLTINGVQQPVVNDPAMAKFGDGRMGFFTATLSDMPAGGFKVLFDNASFWPK